MYFLVIFELFFLYYNMRMCVNEIDFRGVYLIRHSRVRIFDRTFNIKHLNI